MKCNLCLKEVSALKTNSHVIPRFIMKDSKIKGKNVFVSKDFVNEKNQKDKTGDFVCSDCEDLFSSFDNIWAKIFKEKEDCFVEIFRRSTNLGLVKGFKIKIEEKELYPLYKFLLSVLMREHLYSLIYENKYFLGEKHFNKIKEILFDTKGLMDDYPIQIIYHEEGNTPITYPHKFKIDGVNYCKFSGLNFTATIQVSSHGKSDNFFTIKKGYLVMGSIPFDKTHIFKNTIEPAIIKKLNKL